MMPSEVSSAHAVTVFIPSKYRLSNTFAGAMRWRSVSNISSVLGPAVPGAGQMLARRLSCSARAIAAASNSATAARGTIAAAPHARPSDASSARRELVRLVKDPVNAFSEVIRGRGTRRIDVLLVVRASPRAYAPIPCRGKSRGRGVPMVVYALLVLRP